MADPPPPYLEQESREVRDNNVTASQYKGVIRIPVPEPEPGQFSTARDYIHRQNVYITTVTFLHQPSAMKENISSDRSINTLHLFTPESSKYVSIQEHVDLEVLRTVQGFQAVRTGKIDTSSQDLQQFVHDHIICSLRDAETGGSLAHVQDCEWSRHDHWEYNGSATLQIYKIHMFSRHPQGFGDHSPNDWTSLLFKWVKPHSVYGDLSGSWQTDLVHVINHGRLNAGAQLTLLVRGISNQQIEDMLEKRREGIYAKEF